MKNTGIDYSGPGATFNRDKDSGIRYGIIPANDIGQAWYDRAEPDYGDPTCPKCGNECMEYSKAQEALKDDLDQWDCATHECPDYACLSCKYVFGSESAYSEEPVGGQNVDDGEIKAHEDSSGDVWIFHSPYFTYAQFCSPCAPGACYLRNPLDEPSEANKAYCLGHDWFESGKAPYPVYSVETGKIVNPQP